ncbi:MAG TPA: glucoamylase family protein [Candidatus Omnitrophota bacterium]|nr:glucoamylase family protein [Candidatus Omnitrophota bacterium]HPS36576.1 glucoamylase family protein [Candidatus Omnitrophota bacterium]
MPEKKKRSPGFVKNLRGAFFFFMTLAVLGAAAREGTAAQKPRRQTPPQISAAPGEQKKIYLQQIGPAPEDQPLEAERVYQTVPAGKPLIISTQFKVIDDFSSPDKKNRFGSLWTLEGEKAGNVRLERSKEDARGMRAGHSLEVRFNLRKQEQVSLASPLARLDMSAAHFVAVKCKLEPAGTGPFDGRIQIFLTDWSGRTVAGDITGACLETPKWNDAILPIETFRGLDLDQLDHLDITITAGNKRSVGKLRFDEIAFFGHPEVGFESTEDNLKGFPRVVFDSGRRKQLLETKKDSEMLSVIARDTWRYFEEAANRENDLVVDHIKTGDFPLAAMYTSPTNIAMDLMGTVAARELGIISNEKAAERVAKVFATLGKLQRWKGFFFNFYETTRLNVTNNFVSSVDNGWLAIAFVVTRQAFPGEIAKQASRFLDEMHFQEFLDPENNHLVLGYDTTRDSPAPYHYGMLVTEARAMSFFGIGKGDLPREHWWYLYRTAPDAWDWQTQKPRGRMVQREGVDYFQGYYENGKEKFVPSWGGSLFEFLMPALVIQEGKLAPKGLGRNNRIATEIHRDYALKEKKYPVWGISPAATASGRQWQYGEYGVKKLGAKGYPDKGVIAPYAACLALETLPKDAIKNIRELLKFEAYGVYGFYDSISFPGGRVDSQYLALDQGMILLALANHLKKGIIQEIFHKDPIAQKAKDLLKEDFYS